MINENRTFYQNNSENLVYIISQLVKQVCITSRKVMIKYVGPVVIYKIMDLQNYPLKTFDGKILKTFCKHERSIPANIRRSEGIVQNLTQLKQVMNAGIKILKYRLGRFNNL